MGRQVYSPAIRVLRWLRGYWPGGPLRRRCDRAEAAVLGLLLATLAVAGPLAALGASHWAYGSAVQGRHARAGVHQAPAVLLTSATWEAAGFVASARARWTAPDGTRRTGEVYPPAGTPAGTKVAVWLNSSGGLAVPPDTPLQVRGQELLAGMLAVMCVASLLWIAGLGAHIAADRRRMAAWEDEWRTIGPQWSRHR